MAKEIINRILSENIQDKNSVALLFSGGTDSLTCLFSLLEIGVKPVLYTFHLENTIHKDVEVSTKVAQHFKLKHCIISIPEDVEQLKEDVIKIIQHFGITRKTNIQCTYPFLHILPCIKEQYVVSGLCADDLMGTSKSMAIKYAKDFDGFTTARRKILENEYSSAYKPIKELVELHGKAFIAPYRHQDLIDYFMTKSWEEINKPKQKQLSVNAYKEYFDELDIYRRNTNLQVGSKVREWHDELLATELNKFNRKRVDEIYKDLLKEVNK